MEKKTMIGIIIGVILIIVVAMAILLSSGVGGELNIKDATATAQAEEQKDGTYKYNFYVSGYIVNLNANQDEIDSGKYTVSVDYYNNGTLIATEEATGLYILDDEILITVKYTSIENISVSNAVIKVLDENNNIVKNKSANFGAMDILSYSYLSNQDIDADTSSDDTTESESLGGQITLTASEEHVLTPGEPAYEDGFFGVITATNGKVYYIKLAEAQKLDGDLYTPFGADVTTGTVGYNNNANIITAVYR